MNIKDLYFKLSIRMRIGILCGCYSFCIIATFFFGRSDSTLIRYGSLAVFLILGTFFSALNIWGIGLSIQRVINTLQSVAKGDLTQDIVVKNNTEISWVLMGIRDVQNSVRSMIAGMQETSARLTDAAARLKQTSHSMASGAEQAVGQTGSAVYAVEELSSVSADISQNCHVMAGKASETLDSTGKGEATIGEMSKMMDEIAKLATDSTVAIESLGRNSNQIGEIIRTIEDIADQTNLLALNAAIEAARAGEQGRGFAVVADEVRRLSERTTVATREIQKIIATLQQDVGNVIGSMTQNSRSVENGAKGARLSSEAISDIKAHMDVLSDRVAQVATAVEEQSATTAGVLNNIHNITAVIEDVSHGSKQTNQSAAELADTAQELLAMAGKFKI